MTEKLTRTHEESVRRVEQSLLTYTRIQAHDQYQVIRLTSCLCVSFVRHHFLSLVRQKD